MTLTVGHSDSHYPIWIDEVPLTRIADRVDIARYTKALIVTDTNVGSLWLETVLKALPAGTASLVLPPGEKRKNLESVSRIWEALLESGCDRRSLLLALGGGVVCDLAGFAASTFMRGIDYVQIPTTLLAQVDASIGGKTGLNFGRMPVSSSSNQGSEDIVKNVVGTFYRPKGVLIDTTLLSTLPQREFLAGYAEIIKHALIRDANYLEILDPLPAVTNRKLIKEIVERSCRIKAEIVSIDEHESGLRKILNFGHTIGHALEALSLKEDDPLLHGEAISIGMIAESFISYQLGTLSRAEFDRIETLFVRLGLPTRCKLKLVQGEVLNLILHDKKGERGIIKWSLITGIGSCKWDVEPSSEIVASAINYIGS